MAKASTPSRPGQANPLAKPARGHHYHVYVVALADAVWDEPKFRKCNPDYLLGKPLVYVGMSGLDPDVRFDKHKAGIQHNSYVLKHGLHLLPQLYERYNPMPYKKAQAIEIELGILLRSKGYGVWQA